MVVRGVIGPLMGSKSSSPILLHPRITTHEPPKKKRGPPGSSASLKGNEPTRGERLTS